MTVETSASKVVFLGNGATTVFTYSFEIDFNTYVVLTYTDSLGNVLTLGSSVWSITGLGNPAGGTVTYPLAGSPIAAGTTLTLQRVVPFTQPTNLSNQSGLWPSVVMAMDDNLEYQIQQLAEVVSRAIVVSVSETGPEPPLPPPAARALMNLTFDASGNPTASLPAAGTVAISSVMQSVVGAATVAIALAALFATIGTTLPATAGVLWINGGYLCRS